MKPILASPLLLAAVVAGGLLTATSAAAEDTMEISRADSRPAVPGSPDFFTGTVSVTPLFDPNPAGNTSAGEVTFSPCARSAWHTHPAGQSLVVTSGTGWIQQWDGPKEQINPGDVIWTPPGVKHWHGATDTASMTHISVADVVDGVNVDWMEQVSDAQYFGSPEAQCAL